MASSSLASSSSAEGSGPPTRPRAALRLPSLRPYSSVPVVGYHNPGFPGRIHPEVGLTTPALPALRPTYPAVPTLIGGAVPGLLPPAAHHPVVPHHHHVVSSSTTASAPAPSLPHNSLPIITWTAGVKHVYQIGTPPDPLKFNSSTIEEAHIALSVDVYEEKLIATAKRDGILFMKSIAYQDEEDEFLTNRLATAKLKLESLVNQEDYNGLVRLGLDEEALYKRNIEYYQQQQNYIKGELTSAFLWRVTHEGPNNYHTEDYITQLKENLKLNVTRHMIWKREFGAWTESFESAKQECCTRLNLRYHYGNLEY